MTSPGWIIAKSANERTSNASGAFSQEWCSEARCRWWIACRGRCRSRCHDDDTRLRYCPFLKLVRLLLFLLYQSWILTIFWAGEHFTSQQKSVQIFFSKQTEWTFPSKMPTLTSVTSISWRLGRRCCVLLLRTRIINSAAPVKSEPVKWISVKVFALFLIHTTAAISDLSLPAGNSGHSDGTSAWSQYSHAVCGAARCSINLLLTCTALAGQGPWA